MAPNSKPPYGSYLWRKQVEAKHQDDFEGWPVSKKAARTIGTEVEPERYSAEWFDWIETWYWIQSLREAHEAAKALASPLVAPASRPARKSKTPSFTARQIQILAREWIPMVGDGATIHCSTDRYAATIIKIDPCDHGGLTIWLREDCAIPVGNNESGDPEYTYTPTRHGFVWVFRLRPKGGWRHVEFDPKTGRWVKPQGRASRLVLGERSAFQDPII